MNKYPKDKKNATPSYSYYLNQWT